MASKLIKLRLNEVSVVDKGANPGAKLVIAKRAEEGTGLVDRILSVFRKSLEEADWGDLGDLFTKGAPALVTEKAMNLEQALSTVTPEAKSVIMAALQSAKGGAPGAPAPAAPAPQPGQNPFMRSIEGATDEVKKAFEESDKRRVDLEKRVADMEAGAERTAFIVKASAFKHLPGFTPETLAPVMQAVAKTLPKEQAEAFEKALAAANTAVEKSGLLKELGSSLTGTGSAQEQLESIAKKIAAEEKVSYAVAFGKALALNPQLYEAYDKEHQA